MSKAGLTHSIDSPGWPGTCSLLALTFWLLGLQAFFTMEDFVCLQQSGLVLNSPGSWGWLGRSGTRVPPPECWDGSVLVLQIRLGSAVAVTVQQPQTLFSQDTYHNSHVVLLLILCALCLHILAHSSRLAWSALLPRHGAQHHTCDTQVNEQLLKEWVSWWSQHLHLPNGDPPDGTKRTPRWEDVAPALGIHSLLWDGQQPQNFRISPTLVDKTKWKLRKDVS